MTKTMKDHKQFSNNIQVVPINPLTPVSDQDRISPLNIITVEKW